MKTIRVQGKVLRDESYLIKSATEVETGLEINAPSTLINLIRIRRLLRHPEDYGFEYKFPITLAPRLLTNGFPIDFPIIFE